MVAIGDCDRKMKGIRDLRGTRINLDFEFLTDDGKHFEAGQEYLLSTHCILSLIFLLLYVPLVLRFLKEIKKSSLEKNYLFIGINICIGVKLLGYLLELIELSYFSRTGYEIESLNFIGSMLSFIASFGLTCFLIFVAHGWTTKFTNLDEFEFFLPAAILIGIFKLVLLGEDFFFSKPNFFQELGE